MEIPSYFTHSYNDKKTIEWISKLNPNVVVVHTEGWVGKEIRSISQIELIIGGHPGLTPTYRGSHSPFWAIYNKEEKKVATKAPVEDIQIKNLSDNTIKEKEVFKSKFKYAIKIGDFYFKKSAKEMSKIIKDQTNVNSVNIRKISSKQFRVFLGPFNNLNDLKKEFDAINVLKFENLEIIKE